MFGSMTGKQYGMGGGVVLEICDMSVSPTERSFYSKCQQHNDILGNLTRIVGGREVSF